MRYSEVVKRKLQIIHTLSLEFKNVMPYVKNLESYDDLYAELKRS